MRSIPVLLTLLCAAVGVTLFAQNPMRPGRWEVTMQMSMPSMPSMQMPPTKTASCITAEQLAKDPAAGLNSGPNANQCKVTDQKFSGNKVAWKMACTGAAAMTGDGEMTFTGDSYTGTVKMNTQQGAMNMQLAGKRLGDCTP